MLNTGVSIFMVFHYFTRVALGKSVGALLAATTIIFTLAMDFHQDRGLCAPAD